MSFSLEQIKGVMPAFITPYDSSGAVNVPMIRRMAAYHIEQGCCGFFVCGSTGEGLLLTTDERKLVARTLIETVAGQVPVIVHVGAVSTQESAALAADARKAGAAAVSSIPPVYYKVGLAGMLQHIRGIAEAAELPTFHYHIPALTGVYLSADELVEAFLSVPGVAGMKFTDSDMFFLWSMLDSAKGRFRVFNGSDQMLIDGLFTGAIGGIGSTYNYQMRTIAGIYNAMQAGDFETAKQCQWKANAVIKILFRNGGNLACEKAIMSLLGFDVGVPRSPMVSFPKENLESLRKQLEAVHFFD
jgi:N-acetylneuraminate lyase